MAENANNVPPILMSRTNPNGIKLEDLCVKVRQEIHIKQGYIKDDPRQAAKRTHANNECILAHLRAIEALQTDSMTALLALGPNQGPTGTPRVGEGSPGYTTPPDDDTA